MKNNSMTIKVNRLNAIATLETKLAGYEATQLENEAKEEQHRLEMQHWKQQLLESIIHELTWANITDPNVYSDGSLRVTISPAAGVKFQQEPTYPKTTRVLYLIQEIKKSIAILKLSVDETVTVKTGSDLGSLLF